MRRKVVKQGPATFMVSLPSKWVKKYNVQKGDEVDVEENGKSLIIYKEKETKKIKKAVINLDDFNRMLVNRFLGEFYRQGVEEIEIKFTKSTLFNHKEQRDVDVDKYITKVVERFIGMEIVSHTENKIILQNLIREDEFQKLDVVQSRIYFLMKEFLNAFIKAMDGDFKDFHDISYDYHDHVAKFIYYYHRLLYFSDIPEAKKTKLSGMIALIDKIVDNVRHCSERVVVIKNRSPKLKHHLKEIFDLFLALFEIVINKNHPLEHLRKLTRRRYEVLSNIEKEKFTEPESKAIIEVRPMLDIITEFFEDYVALNIEKYVSEV
ncbi:MAG: AbrB/MazE/SpoVT family DNA-binding domain-containing protein [Nanoarchaeota archaeon]|nr:AbrB/MazE/SpoVT family DNA-binding domain-containing protein [Nanoarchaeota archaeon]